jgi:Recombination endonuclease VII
MTEATCGVDGCINPVYIKIRRLCALHYGRAQRNGELGPKQRSAIRHVLTYIDEDLKLADCSHCGPKVRIRIRIRDGKRQFICRDRRNGSRQWASMVAGRFRRRYGMTITTDQVLALRRADRDRCAICGGTGELTIDHCHQSGRLRGILCRPCNVAIGLFRDDPVLIKRATDYLDSR